MGRIISYQSQSSSTLVHRRCRTCDLDFTTRAAYELHRRKVHVGNKPCSICNRIFASTQSLLFHQNASHAANTDVTRRCGRCDIIFTTRGEYDRHRRKVHVGVPCSICKKIFASTQTLLLHQNANHAANSRVTRRCGKCDNAFTSKAAYDQHRRIVHDVYSGVPRRCGKCDIPFTTRAEYDQHRRKVHLGQKPRRTVHDDILTATTPQ